MRMAPERRVGLTDGPELNSAGSPRRNAGSHVCPAGKPATCLFCTGLCLLQVCRSRSWARHDEANSFPHQPPFLIVPSLGPPDSICLRTCLSSPSACLAGGRGRVVAARAAGVHTQTALHMWSPTHSAQDLLQYMNTVPVYIRRAVTHSL